MLKADCAPVDPAARRECPGRLVSDVLSDEEKVFLYGLREVLIKKALRSGTLGLCTVEDVISDLFAALMSRPFDRAFPKGKPESGVQFAAYMWQAFRYALLHAYEKAREHREESLDRPLDDDRGRTLLDEISDDEAYSYEPVAPEDLIEGRLVPRAFRIMCSRRGFSERSMRVGELAFLDGASVADIATHLQLNGNCVSQIKFRVFQAWKEDGLGILVGLENAE